MKKYISLLVLFLALSWGSVSAESERQTPSTQAQTYIVNTNDDNDDGNCNNSHCSLREAINTANSNPGKDNIHFNFASQQIIALNAMLPVIYDTVDINGVVNNDATCPTATSPASLFVVIDGSNANPQTVTNAGVEFNSGSDFSEIRGVSIINFNARGVTTRIAKNITVQCSEIGVNGSQVGPNFLGISLTSDNLIGGIFDSDRNVVSGNERDGIQMDSAATLNKLYNNYIGIGADGVTPTGNGETGVQLLGTASDNIVGAQNFGNVIAYNETGIEYSSYGTHGSNNTFRFNSIFANDYLGIDLISTQGGLPGVVDRIDDYDLDEGPNQLQNAPELFRADNTGSVTGQFRGDNNATITVDFFVSDSCDPSGHGEGQKYLRTINVTTNHLGIEAFSAVLTPFPSIGQSISAIATDENGNTSEFSNCVPVVEKSFTINTESGEDILNGDGKCDTNGAADGEQCSLRAAIEEVNSLPASYYRIGFAANFGPTSLTLTDALPTITNRVFIDATNAAGTDCPSGDGPGSFGVALLGSISLPAGTHLIHLGAGSDGSTIKGLDIIRAPAGGDGIRIDSDDNLIVCNHIRNNGDDGIHITGNFNRVGAGGSFGNRNVIGGNDGAGVQLNSVANGNTIRGNFIGTNETGESADSNNIGVHIYDNSTANVIGGNSPTKRNIISGNSSHGVLIADSSPSNRVSGNYIGLTRNGLGDLGNGGAGVRAENAFSTEIGGSNPSRRNVISGNDGIGVYLIDSSFSVVSSNYIGTDKTGSAEIRNEQVGIRLEDSDIVRIGGFTQQEGNVVSTNLGGGLILNGSESADIINNKIGVGEDGAALGNGSHGIVFENNSSFNQTIQNIISHNFRDGIRVSSDSIFNEITTNEFASNLWMGIDLGMDGVTPNDVNFDSDTGANDLLNFPEITMADSASGEISAQYTGAANITNLRLDFFASTGCDESGHGQGANWIGTLLVNTDSNGLSSGSQIIGGFAGGDYLTVTATNPDPYPHTSEFSACFYVEVPSSIQLHRFESQQSHPGQLAFIHVSLFAFLLIVTAIFVSKHSYLGMEK